MHITFSRYKPNRVVSTGFDWPDNSMGNQINTKYVSKTESKMNKNLGIRKKLKPSKTEKLSKFRNS